LARSSRPTGAIGMGTPGAASSLKQVCNGCAFQFTRYNWYQYAWYYLENGTAGARFPAGEIASRCTGEMLTEEARLCQMALTN